MIKNLLTVNSSKRFDGNKALHHKWFEKFAPHQDIAKEVDNLNQNVLKNLKGYKGVSHLKRRVMNMLIKMATDKEIGELTAYFQEIDKNGTGTIDA